jgi:activator of 2-hydroxyglutaryl-CoA dehydratase
MCPVAFDAGSAFAKDVVGVDIGSSFSKAVVFSDYSILSWVIIPSEGNYQAAADEVLNRALAKADVAFDDIAYVVATGHGAAGVSFADESVSDIICQGRGISYLFPSARTVVDIGSQSIRLFRVDKQGRVAASVLGEERAASSMPGEDIAAGVRQELSVEIQRLIERVGFEPDCALVGGGAKNVGLVRSIGERLGVSVLIPQEPQTVAALGAALTAEEKAVSGDIPVKKAKPSR